MKSLYSHNKTTATESVSKTNHQTEPTYLSSRQLHKRWNFHQESVRRIIREGRLPAVRIGKRLRVLLSDVEAYEAANLFVPRVRFATQGGTQP